MDSCARTGALDSIGSLRQLIPCALLLLAAACAPGSSEPTAETHTSDDPAQSSSPEGNAGHKPAGADARHVLLTLQLTPAGLDVLSARTVELPLPRLRVPQPEPWRVDVEDASGKVLFSASLPAANVLRGEFARAGGGIDGVHLRTDKAAFPLRLPVSPGAARLRVLGAVSTLDPGDSRARGRTPDQIVELGSAPYPRIAP